jgi:hypothetical protein
MGGDTKFLDTPLHENPRPLNITQCRLISSCRYTEGAIQPPINRVPGVKRPWREADHLPPSAAEVRNVRNYASTSPYVLMPCTGTNRSCFIFSVKPSGFLDFSTLKIKTLSSLEKSVAIYQSARRKISDIFYLRQLGCGNIKSRTLEEFLTLKSWEIKEDLWTQDELRSVRVSHNLHDIRY